MISPDAPEPFRWDVGAIGDGFELRLVPGPPQVQRVFELTGTLDALPFVTSESAD